MEMCSAQWRTGVLGRVKGLSVWFLCTFTPPAWFNSHHYCFFRGPNKKTTVICINILCDTGIPSECLQELYSSFFTHVPDNFFPLSIFTLWALMIVKLPFLFFSRTSSLRMLDYEGLFLVELKAISDGCERLVPSPEPWGSPFSLAATESMRQTTNRHYHCTLQTTKTSSVWEGNNKPPLSIEFSTRAKGKALALNKLYMLEMQWICINVHITSVTFVWLNLGKKDLML